MNNYLEKQLYPEARIIILQLLEKAPDGESSAAMLTALLKSTATQLWLDQVIEQADWLAERDLVETGQLSGMIMIKITGKGRNIAKGLARHDGIDRPHREV